jgi:putative hemolysin
VVFEGKVPITDVCRVLNVDATTFESVQGDSESLGGLLLELFSRLPKPGDQTTYAGYTFYVLSPTTSVLMKSGLRKMMP